ncbi:MAG: chromate efflux transporter [Deltaproteobacteria bacterium]|nr:chromate efflux transporter [Deltaproteobacteria bacterium]
MPSRSGGLPGRSLRVRTAEGKEPVNASERPREPDPRPTPDGTAIPHQSLVGVFLRFLRFGLLAWGGPVAQIAMLKRELVEEDRWIPVSRFNRALAVYQVLPGPEAHELCVYFGMLARGRLGALLAGLGFMLPGFVLMLALSWAYRNVGLSSPLVAAALQGLQAVVIALVVRALHRIGRHSVTAPRLWAIAILALAGDLAGVHFAVILALAAVANAVAVKGLRAWPIACAGLAVAAAVAVGQLCSGLVAGSAPATAAAATHSSVDLFLRGLRAGLLTFGGAYTVIPFLRHDAVTAGGWMTDAQFLDGLALGGVLPAPLIIFSTFVGYLAGGPLGAVAMTVGIFLPAFAFTILGHEFLERVTTDERLRTPLDGVVAGVVGLVAATTVSLFRSGVTNAASFAIFAAGLAVLHLWNSKAAVPLAVLAGGLAGIALFR